MLGIKYMGTYKDESQILRGNLPDTSIKFREADTAGKVFINGFLISLPILTITLILALYRIGPLFKNAGNINIIKINISIIIAIVIMFVLAYVHEVIHSLCFPIKANKEIWIAPQSLALFVYSNEPIGKRSFIWMCLAPNIILGFIPFFIWFFMAAKINFYVSIIWAFVSWSMILSGIGDYYNVYNAVRQVPKGARVFNYGFHSYWIKDN
jgi:hypothetical protein